MIAIIATSDQPCWLAEACKILLLLRLLLLHGMLTYPVHILCRHILLQPTKYSITGQLNAHTCSSRCRMMCAQSDGSFHT